MEQRTLRRNEGESMNQEIKKKCGLLLLGIVLLVLLLAIGRIRQQNAESEDEKAQENTQGEQTEEGQQAIPVPQYNGRIRVLIKTNGYAGLYHESLEITEGEVVWTFQMEEDGCYLNGVCVKEEYFPICLEEQEGLRRSVTSLERGYGNPALEGSLEIHKAEQGLVLVNELPLEDYLKYVVPSEMPASYEKEALKAQAVCARTYAYAQMQAYAYPEYLAHVDDSVSFQVYQNSGAAETTNAAVAETAGQILSYQGQAIQAYFFSTSWGHTSNENIWWAGDSSATPYLLEKCTDSTGETLDLTSEEAFLEFLRSPREACYDSSISWYRWTTRIDVETLSQHLNDNLYTRYQANPEAILTKKSGEFVSSPVKTIGTIEKIEVLERGAGGVLQKVQVTGSRRTIQISTEYNIRALLNAQGETICRQDGSEVEGGALLPSGYFTITPEYEDRKLGGFLLEGGGYGHGVGMSQNGANQMAKEGSTWEEILRFFYTGVDLTSISEL